MPIKPRETATTKRQRGEGHLDQEVQKSPKTSSSRKAKLNVPSKFQQMLPNLQNLSEIGDTSQNLLDEAIQRHKDFAFQRNMAAMTQQLDSYSKEKEALLDELNAIKKENAILKSGQRTSPEEMIKLQKKITEYEKNSKLTKEMLEEKDSKIQQLQILVDEYNTQKELRQQEQMLMDQQAKDNYELQINQYKEQLEEQAKQLQQLQERYQTGQSDAEKLQQLLQQKEQEMTQINETYSTQFKQFESQVNEKQQLILDQYQMIKKLEYQIQDLKGKIRITVRIRPSNHPNKIQFSYPDKINYKKQLTYRTQGQKAVDGRDRNQDIAVDFDRVFASSELQNDVFFEFQPLVGQIFDGYKICIFAYGQSGSGKTFTQYGNDENPGIMPMSLQYIFRQLNTLSNNSVSNQDNVKNYKVQVQFYEIYNDKLYDLLGDQNEENLKSSAVELQKDFKAPECKVSIIKDVVKIVNLNTVNIHTIEEAYELIQVSQARRKTSSTILNDVSSRSHAVFTINLLQTVDGKEVKGSLTIVDLAGSEQLQNTDVDPKRKQESIFINQSLSCLGKVFNNLKSGEGHVPYRDSTLTKVLQEYFQGQNKVVMIVCLNEEGSCYQESVNSLNFALRVRGVSMVKK